jgi:hypothetical protein
MLSRTLHGTLSLSLNHFSMGIFTSGQKPQGGTSHGELASSLGAINWGGFD